MIISRFLPILLGLSLLSVSERQNKQYSYLNIKKMSVHEFSVENISGEIFDFAELKGKKIMIVNTASKW